MVAKPMIDPSEADPSLDSRAVALGREGLSRAEIADRLGLSLGELETLEAGRPAFAAAMQRAEDAALAWWEAAPREALAAGVRFNMAAWLAAMRWRFGEAAAAAESPPPEPAPRAILDIPNNHRTKPKGWRDHMGDEVWFRAARLAEAHEEVARLEDRLEGAREWLEEKLDEQRDELADPA
jgi:hypothetical protein